MNDFDLQQLTEEQHLQLHMVSRSLFFVSELAASPSGRADVAEEDLGCFLHLMSQTIDQALLSATSYKPDLKNIKTSGGKQ